MSNNIDDLITPQWTNEDRLAAVNIIAGEMKNDELLTGAKLRYWADRLHFAATASPEFLEANRQAIIYGILGIKMGGK